jgi:hypothetical protein
VIESFKPDTKHQRHSTIPTTGPITRG